MTKPDDFNHVQFSEMSTKNLLPWRTRFLWWVSRRLHGRSIFGYSDGPR